MRNDYINVKSGNYKRVLLPKFSQGFSSFLDESVLPFSVGKRLVNFEFCKGALSTGYGLMPTSIASENVHRVWHYQRFDFDAKRYVEYLMFANKDGTVYYIKDGGTQTRLEGISLTGEVLAVNYRLYDEDVVIMFASEGMFVWNGVLSPMRIEGAPSVTSLAVHYERLFVTEDGEKSVVRFSDDLDPTNWNEELDEGGYIQLLDERGKLNKVVSFINYVYVFRDYGITRLVAFSDQSEFSTSNLFVSAGKIYANSVAVCGDRVMFLAGDGVYMFDGVSTTRVLLELNGAIAPSPNACGVYHDGKYVLAVRLVDKDNPSSDVSNNAIIVFDIKLMTASILTDVNAVSLFCKDEKCYVVTNSGRVGLLSLCGEVFGVPTVKRWESGFIDFDTPEKKAVREICFDNDVEFDLTVYSENGKRTTTVQPSVGLTKIKLNLVGRKLGFTIECKQKNARISRPFVKMQIIS